MSYTNRLNDAQTAGAGAPAAPVVARSLTAPTSAIPAVQSNLPPGAAGLAPQGVNPALLDPSYLAFVRQLGVDEAQSQAEVAKRIGRINGSIEDSAPAFQDSVKKGLQNIGQNYADRGMYGAGKQVTDQNDFEINANRDHLGQINALKQQVGDMSSDLTAKIAQGRRQKAEEQMTARDRQVRENAQYGIV